MGSAPACPDRATLEGVVGDIDSTGKARRQMTLTACRLETSSFGAETFGEMSETMMMKALSCQRSFGRFACYAQATC